VGPRGPDADVLRLMLAWLGVVIVFFSLPSSKPIGYILPAGVPLGYLSARAVRSFAGFAGPGHARWRRAVASTAALAAALCVGAAILAHFYQPKSLRTLAMQLQSARLPGEPVFFLGNYYYDVAFYARLDAPVQVVDAWRPEEIAKDSWRRELVDAERFRAASPTHRLRPDALAPTLCESPSTWVIGPWPGASIGNGPAPQPAYRSGTTALWHVVATEPGWRDRLGCRPAAAPGRGITPTP
jgi:hypothetical protein